MHGRPWGLEPRTLCMSGQLPNHWTTHFIILYCGSTKDDRQSKPMPRLAYFTMEILQMSRWSLTRNKFTTSLKYRISLYGGMLLWQDLLPNGRTWDKHQRVSRSLKDTR